MDAHCIIKKKRNNTVMLISSFLILGTFLKLMCLLKKFFLFGCPGSSLLQAGFSLAAVSGDNSLVAVRGLLVWWLLLLQSVGSKLHGLRCLGTCGIFRGQGLNFCPLHWQADS